ncbi:MAG TPA: C-GCAxxG-C-C family protein [Victivallales bacterium]|nr:C-GCAxxG-C-C family protein [Victivallales bacterium]
MKNKSNLIELSKEDLKNKAYELGYEYELKAHYCPQATLAAILDTFEIKEPTLLKSAFGFHGGGGNSGIGPCGALAGSIIAISYFFGRNQNEFYLTGSNSRASRLVNKLTTEFAEKYNGLTCRDCQKKTCGRFFDLNDDIDKEEFNKVNGHEKCSDLVGKTAAMVTEIIWDEIKNN